MGKRRNKKKSCKNPLLLQGNLFAYVNPVPVNGFNYSVCVWYQEGKIVYSDNHKVIAYTNGYRCQYSIKVYRFRNVRPNRYSIDRLIRKVKSQPEKYQGWLHHINFYSQRGHGPCLQQIKL